MPNRKARRAEDSVKRAHIQVNVMVPADIVDALQLEADQQGISRSDVVRMVIGRHVKGGTKREA
jgi:hypothetical protein